MIQRLQTLFLIVVVTTMLAMLFVPTWSKVDTVTSHYYTMYAWCLQKTKPTDEIMHRDFIPYIFIGIMVVFAALIALYEIYQFKNRKMQLQLGILNNLLMVGIIGLILYFTTKIENNFPTGEKGQYKLGFLLPAIGIVSNLIASRLIRRDEKLVRSVDRIR